MKSHHKIRHKILRADHNEEIDNVVRTIYPNFSEYLKKNPGIEEIELEVMFNRDTVFQQVLKGIGHDNIDFDKCECKSLSPIAMEDQIRADEILQKYAFDNFKGENDEK
jgi:hypothetical protein